MLDLLGSGCTHSIHTPVQVRMPCLTGQLVSSITIAAEAVTAGDSAVFAACNAIACVELTHLLKASATV